MSGRSVQNHHVEGSNSFPQVRPSARFLKTHAVASHPPRQQQRAAGARTPSTEQVSTESVGKEGHGLLERTPDSPSEKAVFPARPVLTTRSAVFPVLRSSVQHMAGADEAADEPQNHRRCRGTWSKPQVHSVPGDLFAGA